MSILPSFSKVFQKIALQQLCDLLKSNYILVNEPLGFCRGLNTENTMLGFVNEVSWALDGWQRTMCMFCDLSKAFECMNHDYCI